MSSYLLVLSLDLSWSLTKIILTNKAKLIDYSIVVLMNPAIMLGNFIGVQVNIIAPQVAILSLLGLVLVYVSFRSTLKGIKLYKEESEKMKKRDLLVHLSFSESNKSDNSEEKPPKPEEIELQPMNFGNSWINSIDVNENDSFNTRTLKQLKSSERRHFFHTKFLIIFL